MRWIAALFVIIATPALAADYVMTDTRLPANQQIIYQRTTGAYIYPASTDPNFAAYQAFLTGGGTPDAPIETAPQGVMVISTGTPALNGPYSFSDQNKAIILQVSVYALANNKFPDNFTQMPFPDSLGKLHTFTLAQWKAFVSALIDYDIAIRAGQSPALPIVIP